MRKDYREDLIVERRPSIRIGIDPGPDFDFDPDNPGLRFPSGRRPTVRRNPEPYACTNPKRPDVWFCCVFPFISQSHPS